MSPEDSNATLRISVLFNLLKLKNPVRMFSSKLQNTDLWTSTDYC